MDYLVTLDINGELLLCLDDDGQVRKLNYAMASKVFRTSSAEYSKEIIHALRPRFILAPRSLTTIRTFMLPFSEGIVLVYGARQEVIQLDRNILLLPHVDLVRDLNKKLDWF